MSVFSVTGVLSVGDVAEDTGFSGMELPSDQLSWLVGVDDVVAAATMAGTWPSGFGLRVPVPELFFGVPTVVLPSGLVLQSYQSGVAVIVAERDVRCPILQYVYKVPKAVIAAESDYAWLTLLSPEARIHAVLALGPSPTIGEIASLPASMTTLARLGAVTYDLVGDLVIRAGPGCSALDMFASFSFGSSIALDSIAEFCYAHRRRDCHVSPRAKFETVVEKVSSTVTLSFGDWCAVSSENRAVATVTGLSVKLGDSVEARLLDCPLAQSYQLILPDKLVAIVGGVKHRQIVTVYSNSLVTFVSDCDMVDIVFTAQVDLDPVRPRYGQLLDYVDSGQFKSGYCYLALIRPDHRLRVARDLGQWPKLSRILTVSMASCLSLSEMGKLALDTVGKESCHLLTDEGGGCVSQLAGVVAGSPVIYELGSFGSVLSRVESRETVLRPLFTIGGVNSLDELARRWFRDKGFSDGFQHIDFSLEWLRSVEVEKLVDVGRRYWMSEVAVKLYVNEVVSPEHVAHVEFVKVKTLEILPSVLTVFSDFPIEIAAIDRVRLFYVSVALLAISDPSKVRTLLRSYSFLELIE